MALRFYNTLSQQVEEFSPARDNTVRMYTCGPTVYDYAHIGNFRTFTFVDILRKWLRASGLQARPRDEHHGRGRQDHPQRGGPAQGPEGIHRHLYQGVSGRLRHAAPGAARAPGARHRPHRRHGGGHRAPGGRPAYLRERRLGLLPHLDLSRLRQALAQRFQRQHGRRARGRGRIREGRCPRFRAVEGAQGGREVLGHAHRPGPARLAHRVLRHGASSTWARRSISTRAAWT